MVEFLIPNYVQEGKTQLVIGIGCTGGKHRSVTLANELYEALSKNDNYGIRIEHRDIGKDALPKRGRKSDVILWKSKRRIIGTLCQSKTL